MIGRFVRALSPTGWALAAMLAIAAILAAWWVLTEPGRARHRAAEAELGARLSDARTESARDAVTIQGNAAQAAAESEQLSRESADVIRNTPGADQRLDPRLNRVGRERLCLRAAYRNRPECVQLARGAQPAG